MRIFYKIENNKFIGFLNSPFNDDLIFDKNGVVLENINEITIENFNLLKEEEKLGKTIIYSEGILTAINFMETITLEEQEEYYRNLIVQKNKELFNIQQAGFTDESLKIEINNLKKKHAEIAHELATIINKEGEINAI